MKSSAVEASRHGKIAGFPCHTLLLLPFLPLAGLTCLARAISPERIRRGEIDNNLVENSIRPTAIGKKNWLFIGDAEAEERSAILESCRRRGINPFDYLHNVLSRLPHATNWNVAELTPENWAKNQRNQKEIGLAA